MMETYIVIAVVVVVLLFIMKKKRDKKKSSPTPQPVPTPTPTPTPSGRGKPVIFDTDMCTDSDDAAALGMLHVMANKGELDLLGVMLSAHDKNGYNSRTVSAINKFYKREVPIGVWEGVKYKAQVTSSMETQFRFDQPNPDFHHAVVSKHPNDGKQNHQRQSSYDLYIALLNKAKASGKKVTLLVVGTNFNIAKLLKHKRDLFTAAVQEVIFSEAPSSHCGVNFCARGKSVAEAKKASDYFFKTVPPSIQLTFIEPSTGLSMITSYQGTNVSSPMKTAYDNVSYGKTRPSWDQAAVLFAARGIGDQWSVKRGAIKANFVNNAGGSFAVGAGKQQLINAKSYSKMGNTIQNLMLQHPK